MIVVDPGDHLCGTGLINGTGFASGANAALLNTGGNVQPGFSPGTLEIDGGYVQEFGTLTLEIGGANAGEFDVLDASQGVDFIEGTLRFVRLNNFVPLVGTQFDFFAGHDVSFTPDVVIEDNTGFGLELDPATGIVTVPGPSTAWFLAVGCVGLVWSGRWRRGFVAHLRGERSHS